MKYREGLCVIGLTLGMGGFGCNQDVGVVRNKNTNIKILGNGKLTKKLNVTAHAFSKRAQQKIEDAGGTATVIGAVESSESIKAEPIK